VVVGVSLTAEQVTEHASQVGNVWLCLELEGAAVGEVLGELGGTSLAEGGDGDGLLLLHDELVLFGGALRLESLPGQSSLEEVYEDVSDGLEVVSAGLFDAQVVVDGCVSGRSRQGASLALGDVLEGSGVTVSLGKTKVDAVDEVSVSSSAVRDKVGGFDITVDQVTGVHEFYAFEHLIGDHEDRFEGEAASALVELVLQGRPEQVHHHQVVRVLRSKVVHLGKARSVLKFSVHLVFVTELRATGSVLFELDGDLFSIGADTEVDITKGTSTDTLGNAVFRYRRLHVVVVYFLCLLTTTSTTSQGNCVHHYYSTSNKTKHRLQPVVPGR